MKKLSTFIYTVSNFVTSENDLIDLDVLENHKTSKFDDVYELLDKSVLEPDKRVVERILDYARSGRD